MRFAAAAPANALEVFHTSTIGSFPPYAHNRWPAPGLAEQTFTSIGFGGRLVTLLLRTSTAGPVHEGPGRLAKNAACTPAAPRFKCSSCSNR
jgi:hypothetical protein